MNGTLREVLNLPDLRSNNLTPQAEEFGKSFRDAMGRLNQKMQLVASQASHAEHEPLEAQRLKLYEAFQKALKVVDPADSAKGAVAADKVNSAVTAVEQKAAKVASDVGTARDEWMKKQADFDDAAVHIGELEEAGHPKAAALVQLGEAIRTRVTGREYRESLTLLDQLLPKLERTHSEYLQSNNGEGSDGAGGFSAEDRDAMWKEIEEIERQLELLVAEHQITL